MVPKRLRIARELADMSQEELAIAAGLSEEKRAIRECPITKMAGINLNSSWFVDLLKFSMCLKATSIHRMTALLM